MSQKKDISKSNKMNAKMYIAIAALSVIATTALVAGITYADSSFNYADSKKWEGRGRRGFSPEKRLAVLEAIENSDYNAWKEAIGDNPDGSKINEENFGKIVEMHNLMQEGKIEEAQAIADEMGVKNPGGKIMKGCSGEEGRFLEMNEAARTALENSDYNAWKEAVADSPIASKINENNFSRLVESHKLMQEGEAKFEEARKIREELGLETGRGFGMMMGMHGSLK